MAFTGSAVITQISERKVRITGLSLAGAAVGTLALSTGTTGGAVLLPAQFQPKPYNEFGAIVGLIDSVQVSILPAGSVTTLVPIQCVKTGVTDELFLITLTNTTTATASAALEIYVEWH